MELKSILFSQYFSSFMEGTHFLEVEGHEEILNFAFSKSVWPFPLIFYQKSFSEKVNKILSFH